MTIKRYCIKFHGMVQGVGFRYFVQRAAQQFHVNGWVRNNADGTVDAEIDGEEEIIKTFIDYVKTQHSWAVVNRVDIEEQAAAKAHKGFSIEA